tara:strand:- start:424 stop:720 length:297 start_codon:yes stop_codon:yes gene_type:complete
MNEVYNLRIGDMLYNDKAYDTSSTPVQANIVAIIYKMTPKYAYYAVCARKNGDPDGEHFVTTDNKAKKENLYKAVRDGRVGISYANGTKRRRKIEEFS